MRAIIYHPVRREFGTPVVQLAAVSSYANQVHFSSCLSSQIRGMSIDQAISQLEFNDKKGAKIMKEVCIITVIKDR